MTLYDEHDSQDERDAAREWAARPVPSADFVYTVTDHQRAAQYAGRLRATMRMPCEPMPPRPPLDARERWLRGTAEDKAWLRERGYEV